MSTSASKPYNELAKTARSLSKEEFLAAHPTDAFVVSTFALTESGYATAGGPEEGQTVTVVPIRKAKGSEVLPNLITVGRASANDVQLRAGSVSKFHACLQRDDEGNWRVVDSNSTFGTYLGEVKLGPGTRGLVNSGDRLRMGNLNLAFYEPAHLYDVLIRATDEGAIFDSQT